MITYERQEWIIVNIDGRKVGKIKIIEKKLVLGEEFDFW